MTELEFLSNISNLTPTLECNLVHSTNYRQYIGTTSVILVFYVVSYIHNPSYKEGPCIKEFFINRFILILRVRKIAKSEYRLRYVCLSVRPSVRVSVHSHGATRLSMDGFLLLLIFE